jgi:hypothetical protein
MSARTGIAEILARARDAAQPAAGPERALAAGDHFARRASILAEIDETMLARALCFRLGTARLAVEARGRRALRVTALEPAEGRAEELRAKLDAGGLKPEEGCALLAELIHEFAAAEGALSIVSEASALPPSVVEHGHAAAELAAAAPELAAAAAAAAPKPKKAAAGAASPLRAFHDSCAGFARAGALAGANGKIQAEHGEGAAARLAQRLAGGPAAPARFLDAAIPGPKLVVLGPKDGSGKSLCVAAEGEETAVAEIAPTDLGAALEAWRAVHG